MTTRDARLRGRQAQAARNDEVILAAAREVFLADPDAPIAAVAERAGVGIGALYHRYASKEDLLRTLCWHGQQVYLAEARRALELDAGPWQAYTEFLRRIVGADTHGLTARLAGRFTATPEMFELGGQMQELGTELLRRAQAAGEVRADVAFLDVGYLLELLSMLRVGDAERTAAMRQRHLALIIDGLRAGSPGSGAADLAGADAALDSRRPVRQPPRMTCARRASGRTRSPLSPWRRSWLLPCA